MTNSFEEKIELLPEIDTAQVRNRIFLIQCWLDSNCRDEFKIEYSENHLHCLESITFKFKNPKDHMMFRLSHVYEKLISEHLV